MTHDFDQRLDRRHSDSGKWHRYDEDVLPMWVADMDFLSPEPVIRALQERVEHGVFGYGMVPPELLEVIVTRLRRLHGWEVSPEALLFLPGVVVGFNLVWHAVTSPGDGVLLQTPIYFPMLRAPDNAGLVNDEMQLSRQPDGRYVIDFDAFEGAITDRTRLFTLCNPHNPVGRVYERDELERMAEVCLRHDLLVCSDEIHCDLVFRPHDHIPIASLDPEIADRTVTLIAPSKTFNIPGLKCSVAIATNPGLRERLAAARQGLVGGVNVMGYIAALAAYRDSQAWLTDVLRYLEGNLDSLINYVESQLPGITMHRPEGTFLAWLDCRDAGIPGNPQEFFLDRARVAMNDGATFGRGGEGFVRLNFACPRSTLTEALDRMREALRGLDQTCGQHSQ